MSKTDGPERPDDSSMVETPRLTGDASLLTASVKLTHLCRLVTVLKII
jgi:hypothetical protein